MKIVAGEGKKREILGSPAEREKVLERGVWGTNEKIDKKQVNMKMIVIFMSAVVCGCEGQFDFGQSDFGHWPKSKQPQEKPWEQPGTTPGTTKASRGTSRDGSKKLIFSRKMFWEIVTKLSPNKIRFLAPRHRKNNKKGTQRKTKKKKK